MSAGALILAGATLLVGLSWDELSRRQLGWQASRGWPAQPAELDLHAHQNGALAAGVAVADHGDGRRRRNRGLEPDRPNLNFNQYVYGAPGTHYRGCVTITADTVNTWGKAFILGLGSTAVGDIGPNTATLSPGGRACGDSGVETVRLTGTASAPVT
jgi:hypothetical protein